MGLIFSLVKLSLASRVWAASMASRRLRLRLQMQTAAAAAPAGDLAAADGAGTAAAAEAGGEEIGRLTKPAGVVLYEAPAADAETGRIRIRCLKTCKKLPGQTIVATFFGRRDFPPRRLAEG